MGCQSARLFAPSFPTLECNCIEGSVPMVSNARSSKCGRLCKVPVFWTFRYLLRAMLIAASDVLSMYETDQCPSPRCAQFHATSKSRQGTGDCELGCSGLACS